MNTNYYVFVFSSDEIMEFRRPKLTNREYRLIIDTLIYAAEYDDDHRANASIYCNGDRIAMFDLITWEDGTADIYMYGQKVRGINKKEATTCHF